MKEQLSKINVLRGIAILLVFGFHSFFVIFGYFEIHAYHGFWFDSQHVGTTQLVLNLNPIGLGHGGVKLFLIISGFLIHWGYLKTGSHFEPAKFYNKRFWRIYPPYLVALFVFGIAIGTGGTFSLLTHLTLTHNLFDSTSFTINASFWSLALEAQLYLLYPLFLTLHKRLGLNWSVVVIASISIARIGHELATGTQNGNSIFKMWLVWVLGAYLGENFFYQKRIYTGRFIYLAFGYIFYVSLKLTILYFYISDIIFSLLCIYMIDWYLHSHIKPFKFSTKAENLLGIIGLYSYSIYLFHQPLLKILIPFFSFNLSTKIGLCLSVGLSFIAVFAISFTSYHLLELTSIKLGNKVIKKLLA